MAIIDLTTEFKDPKKKWTTGGASLRSQFSQATQDIVVGLYGSLYRNTDTRRAVLDANASNKHGKTIIKAKGGRTLKSGRFQGGVIARHKQNYDHLHRCSGARSSCCTSAGSDWGICNQCLDCFLVLDLTRRLASGTIRQCETQWNRGIRAYLRGKNLDDPAQNGRSESRFLCGPNPTHPELRGVLETLEEDLVRQGLIKIP